MFTAEVNMTGVLMLVTIKYFNCRHIFKNIFLQIWQIGFVAGCYLFANSNIFVSSVRSLPIRVENSHTLLAIIKTTLYTTKHSSLIAHIQQICPEIKTLH